MCLSLIALLKATSYYVNYTYLGLYLLHTLGVHGMTKIVFHSMTNFISR